MAITREEILQYCLNQGTGITYANADDFSLDTCSTTDAEIGRAVRESRAPRFVRNDVVEWIARHHRYSQVEETVRNNYHLYDFDEWMALQNILGVDMSYKAAGEINHLLWENYDLSPRDVEVSDYTEMKNFFNGKFMSEKGILDYIFDIELSDGDYKRISRILTDKLGVSLRKLFINRLGIENQ